MAGQGTGHRLLPEEALRDPPVLRAIGDRDHAAPGPVVGGRSGERSRPRCTSSPGCPDMAALELTDALARAQTYPHAVLAYVGPDGYPVNIAVDFTESHPTAPSQSAPSEPDLRPAAGQEVELTFSHIRPQPGVGLRRAALHQPVGTAPLPAGDGPPGGGPAGQRVGRGRHPVLRVRRARCPRRADLPRRRWGRARDCRDGGPSSSPPGCPSSPRPSSPSASAASSPRATTPSMRVWFVLALLAAMAVHLGPQHGQRPVR